MKRTMQKTSINIMAVLIILCCFLCAAVGIGNAWFTSEHNRGMNIVVEVSGLNLCLYQQVGTDKKEVYSNKQNATEVTPKYIELNEAIAPDEDVALELTLENVDAGSGVKLRFALQLIACTASGETPIEIELANGPSVEYNMDGYYYYNDLSADDVFDYGEEFTLCTSFKVPYENFKNMQGGETVKMVLTVQCVAPSIGF